MKKNNSVINSHFPDIGRARGHFITPFFQLIVEKSICTFAAFVNINICKCEGEKNIQYLLIYNRLANFLHAESWKFWEIYKNPIAGQIIKNKMNVKKSNSNETKTNPNR